MDSLAELQENALRTAQAYGFYVLCAVGLCYYLWVRVVRGLVESGVQRARMRAAKDPLRVQALDRRRREARLSQARAFEAEAERRRLEGGAQKKALEKQKKRRAVASHAREYNPLMGPAASRGYRPTSRVKRGGGG